MKLLEDIYPSHLLSKQAQNIVLSDSVISQIEQIALSLNNIKYGDNFDWQSYISQLVPLLRPHTKRTPQEPTKTLPVMLVQVMYLLHYKLSGVVSNPYLTIKDELKKYNIVIGKKFFDRDGISATDYKQYKHYEQPELLFNYQGSKNGILAETLKELVWQAGSYDCFVDLFGGGGGASLAIPRRSLAVYVYNDLDYRLYNLFNIISDDEDYKVLIKYLQKLQADILDLSRGTSWDLGIDFDDEIGKYYKRRKGNRVEREENIITRFEEEIETAYEKDFNIVDYMYNYVDEVQKVDNTKYSRLYKNIIGKNTNETRSNLVKYYFEHSREIYEFSKEHNLRPLKLNSTFEEVFQEDVTNNYTKVGNQLRCYEWYCYFENLDDNADRFILAVGLIYRWSFLTRGKPDISAILRQYLEIDDLLAGGTESNAYLKFLNKDFKKVITEIHKIMRKNEKVVTKAREMSCKTIISNKKYEDVIDLFSSRGTFSEVKHNKPLIYSDYPYQETSGYKVGKWTDKDSKNLIDKLVATGDRFIFSCRASKNTSKGISNLLKVINKNIYDDVINYFSLKGVDLWVKYISLDKVPLDEAFRSSKKTEIMITNFKITGDNVYCYKDFMKIVDKNLIV